MTNFGALIMSHRGHNTSHPDSKCLQSLMTQRGHLQWLTRMMNNASSDTGIVNIMAKTAICIL